MKRKIEILAPAGSYESLRAAIAAGADAVYVGGNRFGARAYADNFSQEELLDAIDYVHLHKKKIYLTVNTLLKEKELEEELYEYLLPYYKQGLDAIIVQDIGVLHFVRKYFPSLPIHASTQMTITGVDGAKFMEEQGVERVVTARELSLKEIKKISEETSVEIESFVHGALCYCYSGQCLYSSLLGGRSGNRGQCAQPCRLPYKVDKKTSYVMSLKDLCTVEFIPDLVEAGIYSFKIEGRMKKPEYVAAVTSIYRKYVDLYMERGRNGYSVSQKDKEILMDLYNRGGFHTGYYQTRNGKEMLSLNRPNHAGTKAVKVSSQQGKEVYMQAMTELHKGDVLEFPNKENYTLGKSVKVGEKFSVRLRKGERIVRGEIVNRTRNEELLQKLKKDFVEKKVQEKINGKLILSTEKNAIITLSMDNSEVTVYGSRAEQALNHPMSEERIAQQMRKTGNTPFVFESLEILLEDSLFIPMQKLNELRRSGLEQLEKEICIKYRRSDEKKLEKQAEQVRKEIRKRNTLYAYVEKKEQFSKVVCNESVERIYIDCTMIEHAWENKMLEEIVSIAKVNRKEIYFAMPYIFREDTKKKYKEMFDASIFDGVLIRNYESFYYIREQFPQMSIVLDANMYQFNREAKIFWEEQKVQDFTAPLELNCRELGNLGCEQSELIVYGYLQMMVSAQCIHKTIGKCTHQSGYTQITDRYNKQFTAKNCCDYCYNIIYNAEPLSLLEQKDDILQLDPRKLRLHFTIENGRETEKILKQFEEVFVKNKEVEEFEKSFTRGHFKRGVK
ncbi:U32 family peptidase [Faecalimonas sp.]